MFKNIIWRRLLVKPTATPIPAKAPAAEAGQRSEHECGPIRAGVVITSPHHDTTAAMTAILRPGDEEAAAAVISSQTSAAATIAVADIVAMAATVGEYPTQPSTVNPHVNCEVYQSCHQFFSFSTRFVFLSSVLV
jgi:hypothetical protein